MKLSLKIIFIVLIVVSVYTIIVLSFEYVYWNYYEIDESFIFMCPYIPEEKFSTCIQPHMGYVDPIRQADVIWKRIQCTCESVEIT